MLYLILFFCHFVSRLEQLLPASGGVRGIALIEYVTVAQSFLGMAVDLADTFFPPVPFAFYFSCLILTLHQLWSAPDTSSVWIWTHLFTDQDNLGPWSLIAGFCFPTADFL